MDIAPNPYQAPIAAELSFPGESVAHEPWKSIAWRWERLRLVYNGLLFLTGLPALVLGIMSSGPVVLAAALTYAVAANVLYLLGPIAEMYLNWLVDAAPRFSPRPLARLVRSGWFTFLVFLAGLLFSLAVTLFGGMIAFVQFMQT